MEEKLTNLKAFIASNKKGRTMLQIEDKFGVSYVTVYRWFAAIGGVVKDGRSPTRYFLE